MKKLLTLTSLISGMAVLALIAGCQTVATNQGELAASKKEFLLAQAGFKTKTVTTPKQQQQVSLLAVDKVTKRNSTPISRRSRPRRRANRSRRRLNRSNRCCKDPLCGLEKLRDHVISQSRRSMDSVH